MEGFNIDNYLRISLTDVVLVMISTALIILIARKFFWSKLVAFIEKRQALIQDNIDSSFEIKKEAQDLKDRYADQMKEAGNQAHQLLEEARDQASIEKKKILNEAQVEAARIREKANEDIEKEKAKASQAMKEAISDVAMDVAKKLVKKEIDEKTTNQYVDDFIRQTGETKW